MAGIDDDHLSKTFNGFLFLPLTFQQNPDFVMCICIVGIYRYRIHVLFNLSTFCIKGGENFPHIIVCVCIGDIYDHGLPKA